MRLYFSNEIISAKHLPLLVSSVVIGISIRLVSTIFTILFFSTKEDITAGRLLVYLVGNYSFEVTSSFEELIMYLLVGPFFETIIVILFVVLSYNRIYIVIPSLVAIAVMAFVAHGGMPLGVSPAVAFVLFYACGYYYYNGRNSTSVFIFLMFSHSSANMNVIFRDL